MILLGDKVPDFTLPDVDGQLYRLTDLRGRIVVLYFWSVKCPWAVRGDQVLASLAQSWDQRVAVLRIDSTAEDTLPEIALAVRERRTAPVLLDMDHKIADKLGAETTPHLFVLDADGRLRYRGAPDDVTFRQRTPTRHYVLDAVQALLEGHDPDPSETLAYGCAIPRI